MKIKPVIIIVSVFVIYIGGFVSGRSTRPLRSDDIKNTERIVDKEILEEKYRKMTQAYIDSANMELNNFSLRYYHTPEKLLPKYYKSIDGEKTEFSKEGFFYYYSMYKITDYLSKSKSIIIDNLMYDPKKKHTKQ